MSHDDFAVEPVRGLPEHLPPGEDMLWQGAPNAWLLAREAFMVDWVILYFVAMTLWRGIAAGEAGAVTMAAIGLIVVAILTGMAWVLAKTTVYTITSRRVVMRVGAALTVSLNLPFTQIQSVDLARRRGGSGTIALDVGDGVRLPYLTFWPHVRPWKRGTTAPALRCIKDVDAVGRILADAAWTEVIQPRVTRGGTGAMQEPLPAE